MSQSLATLRDGYMTMLRSERGASAHTLRAYERELSQFVAYLTKQFGKSCDIRRIEHLHIRAYLAELYGRGLSKASAARALAAVLCPRISGAGAASIGIVFASRARKGDPRATSYRRRGPRPGRPIAA